MGETEFREQLKSLLPTVVGQTDEDLVRSLWPDLKGEFTSGGFAGASPLDAVVEWSRTKLQRLSRKAGDLGSTVLTYLQDAGTQHDLERTAVVVGFLLAQFAHLHVEAHAAAALAVLLVRVMSRPENKPH